MLPALYVREELLEKQFTELLGQLKFDDEVLAWVREALHASHADERREHEEAIKRLQTEHKRLGDRINTMYVDKLDGRVDGAFFDKMSAEWRDEENRCLREIERHEAAEQSYMDDGVQILELARDAQRLFERQEPRQKRRLLNFVLSNCTWEDGEVVATFRQPFDLLAETTAIAARHGEENTAKSAKSEIWLPFLDTYRTMCLAPQPDFRRVLEGVRTMQLAPSRILVRSSGVRSVMSPSARAVRGYFVDELQQVRLQGRYLFGVEPFARIGIADFEPPPARAGSLHNGLFRRSRARSIPALRRSGGAGFHQRARSQRRLPIEQSLSCAAGQALDVAWRRMLDFAHCQNVVLQGTQPVACQLFRLRALDNRQDVDETGQLSGAWEIGRPFPRTRLQRPPSVARNSAAAATAKRLAERYLASRLPAGRSGRDGRFSQRLDAFEPARARLHLAPSRNVGWTPRS